MLEEIVMHVVVVRLRITRFDWVVFIKIEGDYILEADLSIFIHSNQLAIDSQRTHTCSKTKDTCLS